MRKLVLVVALVLMASGAQAASYLRWDGVTVDPIQYDGNGRGNHPYSGANLQPGVVAPGADLDEADLTRADLTNANLSGANLERAGLGSADLTNANLSHADLTGAAMWSITLSNADLRNANLTRVSCLSGNFSNANLSGAVLVHAQFHTVDFNGANLTGADFGGSGLLSGVDLTNANVAGANFSGVDFAISGGLADTTGSPYYDALTDFSYAGAHCNDYQRPCYGPRVPFDPVAAGWVLVPEPNTALLVGIGLAGMAARRRPATAR